MVMEEKYLAFNSVPGKIFNLLMALTMITGIFFREYALIIFYLLVATLVFSALHLRIHKRPSIKVEDGFVEFYREGRLVYKENVDHISSINIERVKLIDRRITVQLKNGEVHDVALAFHSLLRIKEIREITDAIL